MPDIGLSSSHAPLVLILALLLAAAVTALFYRTTLPPVPGPWRIALASFRFLAMFLLFFLLGEPLLSLFRTTSVPPSVIVLLDNSRSMTLAAPPGARDIFAGIATSPEISTLEGRARLSWLRFDHALHRLPGWSPDSIRLDGDRSDLSEALVKLHDNPPDDNVQACIVLTDGNSTSAANPSYAAEALGVPVFTVGVGDSAEKKDVGVSDILRNSIAYAGTRVPVQVTLRSSGYEDEHVEVRLTVQDSVVDRSTVVLGGGTSEYRTTLFIRPDTAGRLRASVEVSHLDGESTYENNRSVFFTNILTGKRTVLLLAGAPEQDVGFIRRSLEADSNTAVETRVERAGGGFLEGDLSEQLIRKSDALFFIGYPGPFTTDHSLRMLSKEEFRKKPVFFMLSKRTDALKLTRLSHMVPVSIESIVPADVQVFMAVPEAMRRHALLRTDQESVWSGLPPLFRPQGVYNVRPEARVIATTRLQSRTLHDPLLVARSVAGQRSVALLAFGVWRWKMLSPLGNIPDSPFDTFLGNVVQWLATTDDQRKFRVTPASESFSSFEPARFLAEVYDESLRPIDGATIRMNITGGERSYSLAFSSIDNGQYEGFGDMLPPGGYDYTATAEAGGIELGTDRGSFSVGELQVEFLNTRLNKDLLETIAFRTGGAYYDAGNISGLADRISSLPGFRTRQVRTGIQLELAHSGWMLGVILLLLSLEWFFRKRLGLL